MFKNIIFISTLVFVAGCDSNTLRGIATLGPDFVRAFAQSPKADPLFRERDPVLNLTPKREPFNP